MNTTTDHDLDDNRQEDHDWDNPPGGAPLPRRRRWLTPGSTLLLALTSASSASTPASARKRPTPPVPDPRGPAPLYRCPWPGRRRRAPLGVSAVTLSRVVRVTLYIKEPSGDTVQVKLL